MCTGLVHISSSAERWVANDLQNIINVAHEKKRSACVHFAHLSEN